jgi:hypothetical protein
MKKGDKVSFKYPITVYPKMQVVVGAIFTLAEVNGKIAKIRFKIPNRPRVCKACGGEYELSMNGGTGEIECMRTGCGYRHGFKSMLIEVDTGVLKLRNNKKPSNKG